MTPKELSELENVLGHSFARRELLLQAVTHSSLRHELHTSHTMQASAQPDQKQEPDVADGNANDNERLEFLGDAIVGLLVAEQLYRRYPDLNEGELTRLRAALVSRKHLGLVGSELDLGSYLRMGKAEERSGGRKKAVLLANCVEALVAALYLESGLGAAEAFVARYVAEPYMGALYSQLQQKRAIGDYKSALQEYLQSRRAGQLEYRVLAETGPDHRKRFHVEVRIHKHDPAAAPGTDPGHKAAALAVGVGSTKKKAEQEAARHAYEALLSEKQAAHQAKSLTAASDTDGNLVFASTSAFGLEAHEPEGDPSDGQRTPEVEALESASGTSGRRR